MGYIIRFVEFLLDIWISLRLFPLYMYVLALAKGQVVYTYSGFWGIEVENYSEFKNIAVTSLKFLLPIIIAIICRILLTYFMRKQELNPFSSSLLNSLSPRTRTVLKWISIVVIIFSAFWFLVFIWYCIGGSLETNPTDEDEAGVLLVTSMISYFNLIVTILMAKILMKLNSPAAENT